MGFLIHRVVLNIVIERVIVVRGIRPRGGRIGD